MCSRIALVSRCDVSDNQGFPLKGKKTEAPLTIEEVIIKEVGQEKWDAMPLADRQGLIEAYARSQFINQETERFIKHFETFVKHSPRGLYVEEAILILARAIQVFQQNHVNL